MCLGNAGGARQPVGVDTNMGVLPDLINARILFVFFTGRLTLPPSHPSLPPQGRSKLWAALYHPLPVRRKKEKERLVLFSSDTPPTIATMTADARPSRTRRYVYGGLLAAVGVAVALALIFTVGGAGQKKDKAAVAKSNVSPLDTTVDIKDALDGVKPVDPVVPTVTTPVTAVTPATPGGNQQTFTQVRASKGREEGERESLSCLLMYVCVLLGPGGLGWYVAVPLKEFYVPPSLPSLCPSALPACLSIPLRLHVCVCVCVCVSVFVRVSPPSLFPSLPSSLPPSLPPHLPPSRSLSSNATKAL